MNRSTFSAIALSFAALTAGQAMAADVSAPLTRDQVKAELAEAQRTGNILADGQSGMKMNELFPGSYPAKAVTAQGKTRDQVKAELIQAIQAGTLPVYSGA